MSDKDKQEIIDRLFQDHEVRLRVHYEVLKNQSTEIKNLTTEIRCIVKRIETRMLRVELLAAAAIGASVINLFVK
ncbi:MAG: hypothetical protein ISN28_15925 [Ectothiorhodospiraceae bacterium AqS1]|nr:hypothetical protein [Ectothiorhodospiraceae bacterium AqS1]